MKRKYKITKLRNGFVIELEHDSDGHKDESKYVAKSLTGVMKILKENLTEKNEEK